jgi:glycerophosphoryl diester phosphodiesterase
MASQQPQPPSPVPTVPETAAAGGAALRNRRPRRPYTTHDRPLFFAHRGGSLLAPENTLVAFEKGASYGANCLELDIQTTSDGELVVIHDPTVDRTTNGSGSVASFSLAELQKLDAGYRFTPDAGQTFPFRDQGITIPTLREVMELFPTLRINIDLKESSVAREKRLWELLQDLHAEDRALVASGDFHAPIVRFRKLCGRRVATSASAWEIRLFLFSVYGRVARFVRPPYDALQVPETWQGTRIVFPAMVAAAHRLGLDVHVWTVDDRPSMDRLLALGVDGLMSDRPDILAEALANHL